MIGTGLAGVLVRGLQPVERENPVDASVFLAIPMALALVSAVAFYLASRRAFGADRMEELREE